MARWNLARTGNTRYQQGYIRSRQWGFRRVRYFRDVRAAGREPACQVCGITLEDYQQATGRMLDVHHVRYDGVIYDDESGRWFAREKDEDLMEMCREDHQQLHRIMDRTKEFYGWSRERATAVIVVRLKRQHEQKMQRAERASR